MIVFYLYIIVTCSTFGKYKQFMILGDCDILHFTTNSFEQESANFFGKGLDSNLGSASQEAKLRALCKYLYNKGENKFSQIFISKIRNIIIEYGFYLFFVKHIY